MSFDSRSEAEAAKNALNVSIPVIIGEFPYEVVGNSRISNGRNMTSQSNRKGCINLMSPLKRFFPPRIVVRCANYSVTLLYSSFCYKAQNT